MAASGKLRSRCTRQTMLRGPNNPLSLGRSTTERSKARASGAIILIWDPPAGGSVNLPADLGSWPGTLELTSPRYRHHGPGNGKASARVVGIVSSRARMRPYIDAWGPDSEVGQGRRSAAPDLDCGGWLRRVLRSLHTHRGR